MEIGEIEPEVDGHTHDDPSDHGQVCFDHFVSSSSSRNSDYIGH